MCAGPQGGQTQDQDSGMAFALANAHAGLAPKSICLLWMRKRPGGQGDKDRGGFIVRTTLLALAGSALLAGCSFRCDPCDDQLPVFSLTARPEMGTFGKAVHIEIEGTYRGTHERPRLIVERIDSSSRSIDVSVHAWGGSRFLGLGIFSPDTTTPAHYWAATELSVCPSGIYTIRAWQDSTVVASTSAEFEGQCN